MKRGKITIENLTGGWAKDFGATTVSRNTNANGYTTGNSVHFSKPGFLGDISSTPQVTQENIVTSGYNGKVVCGTTTSDGVAWLFTSLGTTYKRSTAGVYTLVDDLAAVTRETMSMWVHIDTSGNERVFQSYVVNGSGWYVDQINPSTNARTNLNFYSLPTSGEYDYPRKGIVGPANKTYITNGEFVATYDPVSNDFSRTSLLLGRGWISTSIRNYGNYVAVVGYKGTGESRLWLWDGSSANANFSYSIDDQVTGAVLNDDGALLIFTKGKNSTTKLRKFNGNEIEREPVWEYPTSIVGDIPGHDSADFYANQLFWTNRDGQVFSYGTPNKSLFLPGVHLPFTLNVSSGNGGGMVKNLQSDILFVGGDNNTSSLTTVFTTQLSFSTSAPAVTGSLKTKLYDLPYNSTIETIKVYFSNFGGAFSTFDCELYKNYSTTDLLQHSEIQGVNTGVLYYYPIRTNIQEVDSFYLNLRLANCSVRKIEVIYSYDDSQI